MGQGFILNELHCHSNYNVPACSLLDDGSLSVDKCDSTYCEVHGCDNY